MLPSAVLSSQVGRGSAAVEPGRLLPRHGGEALLIATALARRSVPKLVGAAVHACVRRSCDHNAQKKSLLVHHLRLYVSTAEQNFPPGAPTRWPDVAPLGLRRRFRYRVAPISAKGWRRARAPRARQRGDQLTGGGLMAF